MHVRVEPCFDFSLSRTRPLADTESHPRTYKSDMRTIAYILIFSIILRFDPVSSAAPSRSACCTRDDHNPINKKSLHFDKTSRVSQLSFYGGGIDKQTLPINQKIKNFLVHNEFTIGMCIGVIAAKVNPHIGRNYGVLRADLWIGSFGVFLIFFLSSLATESFELQKAISNIKLNLSIQFLSFIFWPFFIGVPLVHFISRWIPSFLSKSLLDGVLILTCLPCTINMAILLTGASGGNIATALCNTVIGNLLGIIVTPALLLYFFGSKIALNFLDILKKLGQKVLLPVVVGQILRSTNFINYYQNRKKWFSRLQQWTLNAILWNTFSNSFFQGMSISVSETITLTVLLSIVHLLTLKGFFELFQSSLFQLKKDQVVAAMFCSSHKTLAFGLPLVKTIFEGSTELASYCAPIMLIHPIQLMLGSLLAPHIRDNFMIESNKEQIG